MKRFILLIICLSITYISISQVRVNGYYRKNGTYVQPHYRSSPDGNPYNNYSFPGNFNPYTGEFAKGNPDTYLSKYYKIYSTYTPERYSNYVRNLCGTNYSGLEFSKSYSTKNYDNQIIGYVIPIDTKNSFAIFDDSKNQIGVVRLSNNRKRFTVYSMDGYKIASNKNNTGWTILGVTLGLGLGVLIGSAFTY